MPDKKFDTKIRRIQEIGLAWGERLGLLAKKKAAPDKNQEKQLKFLLLIGFSMLAALIIHPFSPESAETYTVGDIAETDIKAPTDLLIEDEESTAKRRRELLDEVLSVYDLDERVGAEIQTRVHEAFAFMRQTYQGAQEQLSLKPAAQSDQTIPPFSLLYQQLLDKKPEFDRLLGTAVPEKDFAVLARARFSPCMEELICQQFGQIMTQGIIGDRATLGSERGRGIVVRSLPSKQERIENHPEQFLDLKQAKDRVGNYCYEVAADLTPEQRRAVCELARSLLIPNLTLNRAETAERKLARLKELPPVYFRIKKGEMLVREGERITPTHLIKLQALQEEQPQEWWIITFLATALMIALMTGIAYQMARLYVRKFSLNVQELTFLATLLLAATLLNQGLISLAGALNRVSPLVANNLVYLLPVALAPMLARIFLGLETAVGVMFLAVVMTGLLLENPFPIFVYFAVGGLIGVWSVHRCRNRWALFRAGLVIGLVNLAMLVPLKLLELPLSGLDFLNGLVFALGGGLLSGILVTGLTPVIEMMFNFTSDIRLLELHSLDQPILRELMVVAPGTYHHSIIVGNLVEAAAEAIGANPLLAKTAAYYHDIGKIKKPAYFVENQLGGENKHEKLAPSMSSLILISHVKDGVELARKNKVGNKIIDIIRQHHGTSLISYFYHKAKQASGNPQQVNIDDFRYPGPRPQTKEAGLVLLADQVEAASKTLVDPTPARIKGLVQKIINQAFADGQLDECELTLKDLHLIAKSFIKILSGIFHQRIEYPGPVDKLAADKKKSHEDLDKQPAKKDSSKSPENQEKGHEDLKRLGSS